MVSPSDLQWFPIALAGGLHASKAIPDPTDFEKLENIALFRGRFALRAPLTETVKLVDDNTNAVITHVLALQFHVDKCYALGYSSGESDVYLYRLEPNGAAESGDSEYPNASPIATVWSSITTVPRVTMVSFEGGSATAGKQRLYMADYTGTYPTKYWDSDTEALSTVQEDFDDDGSKEDLYFPLVFSYNDHVFGTDFYQISVTRLGLLRFSQPGLIPADEPGVSNNVTREWWFSDHRQVGSRGQAVTCIGETGVGKILFKRRETYVLYGFDAQSFTLRRISRRVGALGPHAAADLPDGRCVFWSDKGPHITDGNRVLDIGEPIRDRVVSTTFSEDVSVEYSPDDGLCFFIVPDDGGAPYLRYAWDVLRERWVDVGTWRTLYGTSDATRFVADPVADSGNVDSSYDDIEWLNQLGSVPATWYTLVNDASDSTYWEIGTNGVSLFADPFTAADGTDIVGGYGWTGGSSLTKIYSNKAKNLWTGSGYVEAFHTAAGLGAATTAQVYADITLSTAFGTGEEHAVVARCAAASRDAGIFASIWPETGGASIRLLLYRTNSGGTVIDQGTTIEGIPASAGDTFRVKIQIVGTTATAYLEPEGGGVAIASTSMTLTDTLSTQDNVAIVYYSVITSDMQYDNFTVLTDAKDVAKWAVQLDVLGVNTVSTDPDAEHRVYLRTKKTGTLAGTFTVSLYEGDPTDSGTLRATRAVATSSITTDWADLLVMTLTAAEAASISDWDDLWVEAVIVNENTTEELYISEIWGDWQTQIIDLRINDIRAIPDDALPGPVGAPTSVSVETTSDIELTVSWLNADTAIDVETDVYRSTSSGFTPGPGTFVATVLSGVSSYLDDDNGAGLTPKTTYYYKLIARRNGQSSSASTQASGRTALARPTDFTVSSLSTGAHIAFTHNADGSDYVIERKPIMGPYSELTTVSTAGAGAKTYDDTTPTCGQTYTYRVYATESGETDSPYSPERSWVACSTIPVITAAAHATTIGVDCPAVDNVTIEWSGTGFKAGDTVLIERDDDGAGYTTLKTVPLTLLATTDMWGRRSGAVSQSLQYRLTPYDGGLYAGTSVETTLTNDNVNAAPCPEAP